MKSYDHVVRLLLKYRTMSLDVSRCHVTSYVKSYDIARSSYYIPHERESQKVFEHDQKLPRHREIDPRWLRRRATLHDLTPMVRDHPKITHRGWSEDVLMASVTTSDTIWSLTHDHRTTITRSRTIIAQPFGTSCDVLNLYCEVTLYNVMWPPTT